MEALVFPSEEALQVALRTGLIPPEVQRAAAKAGVTSDGAVEVAPAQAVTAKVKKSLQSAGVAVRDASVTLDDFSCWAEVLPPRAVGEPAGALPLVLFTVSGENPLLEVAGELLRLGCDRLELQVVDTPRVHALLRVVEPPWFVLSRALDEFDGLRAFVPAVPGQERVWTQLGYAHPLHATLEAPDSGLVLVPRDGPWWRLADGTWTDLDALLVSTGLPARTGHAATTPPLVEVKLSLARTTRTEAPTLFVLPDGHAQVEALVRSTPEAQLEDVLFAVSGSLVLLRPRPGREAATLALPGTPYARVQELPNLFAPLELTIEPPLRRDRLRTWLAPDPEALTWLQPAGRGFDQHTISESAFRPLADWVEYVIDGQRDTLTAWARSATFDFEAFATSDEVRGPVAEERPPAQEPVRPRTRRTAEPRRARERSPEPVAETPATPPRLELALPSSPSEAEEVVAHEEATFLELDAPADAPARRTAWARLGELYARVTRTRDSGMAWAHAVWEAPEPEALELARRWASTSGVRLDAALTQTTPNVEQTRGAAAHLYVAALEQSPAAAARVTDYAAFVERFADGLDVRSYWLSHVALARLSGGDPLRLARARDRVLSRLQSGLSLERDVPRLLRVSGQAHAGGAGTSRATRVVAQLDTLLRAFDDTQRKRSTLEAPWELTRAYVWLEFAWGFARLAHPDRARALCEASRASVHDWLASQLPQKDRERAAREKWPLERVEVAVELFSLLTKLPEKEREQAIRERWPVETVRLTAERLRDQPRVESVRLTALPTWASEQPYLDPSRAAHSFLLDAYVARVTQALEGVDPATPLPATLADRLLGLAKDHRYRVDRLRQNSVVLEPQERVASINDYVRRTNNPKADELASLSTMREPAELLRGIRSRMESLPRLHDEERARVADALLDYLPQLPESQALPLLNEFTALADKLPARQRTLVLEDALRVAGHFGREALVKQLVLRLTGAIAELAPTELEELGTVLVSSMRSLRRVGLRTEAAELLTRAITVLKGDDVATLQARLGLASGFMYLGAFTQAQPIVDDALARLGRESMHPPDRMRLSRATAQVFSHASTEVALPGLLRLAQQLPWMTDSFSTNTHFCVSLVEFADALVLGHVGDDLTLNETTRRFLDEDEFLVRRRVHRDVGSTS